MDTGEPPVVGKAGNWKTQSKGWIFGALMFFSSLFGSFYVLIPLTPLLYISPKWWRKAVDRMVGLWLVLPSGILKLLFGTQVRIIGDLVDHSEPAVIIMNHRTRLDWLFFWTALYQQNPWLLISEKITLKGILKYVPGAGWAMQCNNFLFLDRSFETDQSKLDMMLDYYANIGLNYQVLLYPEGTDKCPKATSRSKEHAEKKNKPHYNYLLHTRTTGFVFMIQKMRKAQYIKYLYDVTVGYKDCIVQTEVDLVVQGLCPTDVHYQVIKISIDELPLDDAGLANWLIKRWEEKERKLEEFYKLPLKETFSNTENGKEYKMSARNDQLQNIIVGVWTMVTIVWGMGYFVLPMQWVYSILSSIYFFVVFKVYGGVEWLAIDRFRALSSSPSPTSSYRMNS